MATIKSIEELKPYMQCDQDEIIAALQGQVSSAVVTTIKAVLTAGHTVDTPVVENSDWRIILNVRPEPGETRPEMHRDWHDVSLYLSGINDLMVGTKLEGAQEKEPGNGEWRAGTIIEPHSFNVQAGDLIVVPSNIPHQNYLQPKTAFLVLKVRKGQEKNAPLPDIIEHWNSPQHIRQFAAIA